MPSPGNIYRFSLGGDVESFLCEKNTSNTRQLIGGIKHGTISL